MISNNLELVYKYKIKGEKWGCIRTDLIKSFPFPEIQVKGCYNLSYLWFNLASKYKVLCVNIALRNYFQESDSITKKYSRDKIKSAYKNYHYLTWHLNNNFFYVFRFDFIQLLKIIYNVIINSALAQIKFSKLLSDQRKVYVRFLIIIFFLPSVFFYNLLITQNNK